MIFAFSSSPGILGISYQADGCGTIGSANPAIITTTINTNNTDLYIIKRKI
jgi:hypothetical protein